MKESPLFTLLHDMKNGNIGKNLRVALLVAFLVAVSPGFRPCFSQEVTNSVPGFTNLLISVKYIENIDRVHLEKFLQFVQEFWMYFSYQGEYSTLYDEVGGAFYDYLSDLWDTVSMRDVLANALRLGEYYDDAHLVSLNTLFSEMGVDIDNLLSVSEGIRDQTDNLTFDEHSRLLVQDQELAAVMQNIYNNIPAVPDYSDALADLNSGVSSLGSDVGAMIGTDVGFGGSTGTSELQEFDRDFARESTSADTWLNSNELDNKGQPPDLALDSQLSVVSMDVPSMSGSFNVTPAEYTPRDGDDVITFLDSNSAKNILEAGRVHVTNLPRVEFSLGSQEQDFQAWVSRIGGWFDELWHWLGVFARFVIAIGIFRPLVRDMLVRRI